tara:strand:- start:730 stop:1101 length:372 start_codon:yes stop_codon:yes gene_type:complete
MWLKVTRVKEKRRKQVEITKHDGVHVSKKSQKWIVPDESYFVNENSIRFVEYTGEEVDLVVGTGNRGQDYVGLMNIEHFDGTKDERVVLENVEFDNGYTWEKYHFTKLKKDNSYWDDFQKDEQ